VRAPNIGSLVSRALAIRSREVFEYSKNTGGEDAIMPELSRIKNPVQTSLYKYNDNKYNDKYNDNNYTIGSDSR